jgi:hypothetical protein
MSLLYQFIGIECACTMLGIGLVVLQKVPFVPDCLEIRGLRKISSFLSLGSHFAIDELLAASLSM